MRKHDHSKLVTTQSLYHQQKPAFVSQILVFPLLLTGVVLLLEESTHAEKTTFNMLTVRDVANILHVSSSCIYQLVESGKLSHHRIGTGRGAIRVSNEDLQIYLNSCREEKTQSETPQHHPLKKRMTLKHLKL